MSETGEGNPVVNFKKTVVAQQERVESMEKPVGLIDKFVGKHTTGEVEAQYGEGYGGSVYTRIISGNAKLSQRWAFDKQGEISSVKVSRYLHYDGSNPLEVSHLELVKGEDGKFHVKDEKSNNYLQRWQKEFNTAEKRMQAHRNIPSHPKPQPPQK